MTVRSDYMLQFYIVKEKKRLRVHQILFPPLLESSGHLSEDVLGFRHHRIVFFAVAG